HRPGNPKPFPRSHRMPCGGIPDVPGRVHISVGGVSAGPAPVTCLALARFPVHDPARRATLARVRGIDLHDPSRSLVLQAGYELSPPGGEDAPVEPRLLPDVTARRVEGAFRRADHVGDLQVLDDDHVEPA